MSILVVQGHGVAPEVKLKATLLGLQHGQSHPWLGFGVHCHQETVPHLNFHVLELGKLVAAVCHSHTFCHLLLELHRTLVCFFCLTTVTGFHFLESVQGCIRTFGLGCRSFISLLACR